ncbi:MAG: sodium-dependent transporter [Bdellovibrionales bacterium]|nr:sodium-dependent transporter [Bdellovibrionales bacterium]
MGDSKTTVFGTRFGFYLVAIGSAFGLGNLWRFPYVAVENGGGAFVLLYLFLVFLIGMPLLIAELALGKISRNSLIPAVGKLLGERYQVRDIRERVSQPPAWLRLGLRHLGGFSMAITIIVLAYYAVISGWVLHFLMQLLVSAFDPERFRPDGALKVLLDNGWLQLLLTSVHLLTVGIIVAKDLEFGLEKWVGYCMPAFVLLVIGLAVKSLNLESAHEALRFLFYPDFSKLTLASAGQALGHVLFTLSVGFGSMVTFGSYLSEKAYLPMAGFRVSTLDSLISLWAGVMIFPLVVYGGQEFSGPQLLFQTVPHLVKQIPGGNWFGVGFFLCLYLASLGASIGLFETVVANWREARRMPRPKGAFLVAAVCFVLAVGPALSTSVLSNVRIGSYGLLGFFDAALINWCLPIAALLISQAVCWMLKQDLVRAEFVDPELPGSERLFKHWIFVLRYVVTPVVVLALVLQLIALF